MTPRDDSKVQFYDQREPAFLYLRSQPWEEEKEGMGCDAQEARLRAYAATRGLRVVEAVIDRDASCGTPLLQRRGGQRLLDLLGMPRSLPLRNSQRGPCHVVTLDAARLFGSIESAVEAMRRWRSHKVFIHLVNFGDHGLDTSNATFPELLPMLRKFAALESVTMRDKALSTREQAVMERIRELRARALSLRRDVDDVNDDQRKEQQ